MNARAMHPHGQAMLAFHAGDHAAELAVERDDGYRDHLPVSHFFRTSEEFFPLERIALDRCGDTVLDIGAGSGLHTLALQERGAEVTALDICPEAVEIMRGRGVRDARVGDVFAFDGGPYDTLLLLGHGIGMVEDLEGLKRFLPHARRLTTAQGRVLVHSIDVRDTEDPLHLAYHAANREAGRYVGETRLRFAFGMDVGPWCGWLHVDPETLGGHSGAEGWAMEIAAQPGGGEYLAQLTRT
jgi:SAM-dependent methyltransferase